MYVRDCVCMYVYVCARCVCVCVYVRVCEVCVPLRALSAYLQRTSDRAVLVVPVLVNVERASVADMP